MKLDDLRLDTVYADHDGTPLVLVSLDKYVQPKTRFSSGPIRPKDMHDRSFGLICVQPNHTKDVSSAELLAEAERLRDDIPTKESWGTRIRVRLVVPRLIIQEWGAHVIQVQAAADHRKVKLAEEARARQERSELIARVRELAPAGVEVTMYDHRDHAQIGLRDLVRILEAGRAG